MRLIPFRRRPSSGAIVNQGLAEMRAFSLADLRRYGYGTRSGYTSESDVRGIPAINRAARLRAEAVASLRLRCWSGEGADRERRDNVWQAKLFKRPANEYQTRFGFMDALEESLAYRGNAFVWKNVDPLSQMVVDWYALHPDQISYKSGKWQVTVGDGYIDPVGKGRGRYMVGEETILHIRGHGDGGTLLAPSPVEQFACAMAGTVYRQKHEERMWRKGTTLQLGVKFAPGVTKKQADEWRELWQASYEGTDGDTTPVIGGGGDFVPIGMNAADSKFVEMADLTVLDASLIMGVPLTLLRPTSDVAPDMEQELTGWLRFGLSPELERIESALVADPTLFGGAQTYPKFEVDAFIRGDVKTEAEVDVSLVQAGILTPDEVRARRGLPPLPAGVGGIPQITPVGGAPNPNLQTDGGAMNGGTK